MCSILHNRAPYNFHPFNFRSFQNYILNEIFFSLRVIFRFSSFYVHKICMQL